MKAFKTLLGILFIVSFFSECFAKLDLFENLEKKLILYNYVGVASNGSSILVWGNTGEVLRSIDGGKNWERTVISNDWNYYIVGIETIGKKYIGVLNQNYGILSTDDGESWKLINIGEDELIYKIFRYRNNLYYMTKNKFKAFDENFNLVKEFNYTIDTNYYEFVVTNNTIVYPNSNGEIKLINIENSQETTLDLKSANLCDTCFLPTNFLADENDFYFLHDKNYFRYRFLTESFSLFARTMKATRTAFTLWNGTLYQIVGIYLSGLDSLYFYRLSLNREKVNTSSFDRRVIGSEFTSLKFITDSLIIGVGKNKLVCLSTNGGKTWSVISFVNMMVNPGNLFVFDTLNLRVVDYYHNFYYTTNGGITWLPTRWFPKKVLGVYNPYLAKKFYYFFDPLNGISVYSKSLTPDSNIIYTTDGGETINLGYNSSFNYLEDIYFTLPNGDKLLVFTNNAMVSYGIWFIVWEVDKNFNFSKKDYSPYRQIYYPVVSNNQIIAPSISQPPGKTFGDPLYWIIKSSDWGLTWDSILVNTFDSSYLPQSYGNPISDGAWSLDGNVYVTFDYYYRKDSSSPPTPFTLLYHFDPLTNELSLLDSIGSGFRPIAMFKLQNKYYLLKNRFAFPRPIFKLNVFNEPKTVREVDLSSERIFPTGFVRSTVDPNLVVANIWDTLRFGSGFVYLMKDNSYSSVEDAQLDVRYYTTHFYATQPYPLPARSVVKSKIYTDGSFNLWEAIDGVYDVMGNKLEGKERISIQELGKASALLTWECSGVPTGVYFIVVRHNFRAELIPVVVE
ncbi:MAG: hypothetical protein ACK42Z_02115 [Candidatus Kapaibacteriota bacterium]